MTEPNIAAELSPFTVPVEGLRPYHKNPNQGDVPAIMSSLSALGQYKPIVVNRGTITGRPNEVLAGNHTLEAVRRLGWPVIAASWVDVDEDDAARIVLADNRTAQLATYNDELLVDLLRSIPSWDGTGWDAAGLDAVLARMGEDRADALDGAAGGPTLADRFLVPPFTVLDARSGPWRARKRDWIARGLRSELGRDEKLAYGSNSGADPAYYSKKRAAEQALGQPLSTAEFERSFYVPPAPDETTTAQGTSVFDPVLCELAVRWFCPPGGRVVDPWAGGSVRGLVSTALGREYTGIELRREQVLANRAQVEPFLGPAWRGPKPTWIVGDAAAELPALAGAADMVLGCPPYFDLESYSEDPADLSTLDEAAFLAAYGTHLELAYRALKADRFCFMFLVVGSVRDKTGRLRDLRSETVRLAEAAGFRLANDGILLTPIGSASIRTARAFTVSRALGRVHQDLLVFAKGDRRRATAAVGDVVVDDALIDVAYAVEAAGDDPDVRDAGMPAMPPATGPLP